MDERLEDLRSSKESKARIKVMKGHFASSNAHLDTYMDLSTVKIRHNHARETAKVLAQEYVNNTYVDTIVCMDETGVIGAFMAEELADGNRTSLSAGNNISVITPEYRGNGQVVFRDNQQRMVKDQQVLILTATIITGRTLHRAMQSVLYYGGTICGIASIFSAATKVAGMEVKSIFTSKDIPEYHVYDQIEDCPMCKAGKRVEAIVNSYGYSKL